MGVAGVVLGAAAWLGGTSTSHASGPSPTPTVTAAGDSSHCLPGPGHAPVVPCTGGGTVPYAAGWNLISAPQGTVISDAAEPLYTFQAGDSDYETVPSGTPLQAGVGYWARFSQPTTEYYLSGNPRPAPVTVTAPAGQFIMVGDPFPTNATVSGADRVLTYDPQLGYQSTTTLHTGQGAWVLSANGGTITISSS